MNNDQSKTKRFTKQRQAILETLRNTTSHPDANWIYKKVSKKIPNISLGTVYRNLSILKEENLLKELNVQPNVTRYDGNTMPHHHITCIKCNKIEDIPKKTNCDIENQFKNEVESNLGFAYISCDIFFTGLCADCRKSETNISN